MSRYPHPQETDPLIRPTRVLVMQPLLDQQRVGHVDLQQNRVSVASVASTPPLSHSAQQVTCPFCFAVVLTKVNYEVSMKTHLAALLSCPIVGYCCCCFGPYCKFGLEKIDCCNVC